MSENTPTTTFGIIVSAAAPVYGLAHMGQIFEANDLLSIAPAVGNTVLADYIPASRQWIIVAIVP